MLTYWQFLCTLHGKRSSRFASCVAIALGGLTTEARGQFGPANTILPGGSDLSRVHLADLDGDGDPDLIACNKIAPALTWHTNLGGGVFGPAQILPAQPFAAEHATAVDLNNDGHLDIVAAVDYYTPQSGNDYQLAYYINQGGGNFPSKSFLHQPNSAFGSFTSGDVEGDGDIDLLYTDWGSQSLVLLRRIQPAGFTVHPLTNQVTSATSLEVADLDGDGDLDPVLALYHVDQVVWFENLDGIGTLGPKRFLNTVSDGPNSVHAADLDGDGDLDVLSASAAQLVCLVHWYENLGGGSFAPARLISSIGLPGTDVLAVDFDGDGNQDVAVSEFGGASWYPNHGNGNFGSRQVIVANALGGLQIEVPDVNGDGAPDLLLASRLDSPPGTLAWFENQVVGPLGVNYCGPAVPNSTGLPSAISAIGSAIVAVDHVRLIASNLPLNKPGLFIASAFPGFVSHPGGSLGNLCLGNPIKRIVPGLHSGSSGLLELSLELSSSLGSPIQPGQTWYLQGWHRDLSGTSNLTDGLRIDFAP